MRRPYAVLVVAIAFLSSACAIRAEHRPRSPHEGHRRAEHYVWILVEGPYHRPYTGTSVTLEHRVGDEMQGTARTVGRVFRGRSNGRGYVTFRAVDGGWHRLSVAGHHFILALDEHCAETVTVVLVGQYPYIQRSADCY